MPAYNLSRAHWVAEVDKIQERGERVTAMTADGDVIRVVTELAKRPHWEPLETRAS